MPESSPVDLCSMRIGALLNTSSGSCDLGAEHELDALLQAHSLRLERVWCRGGEAVSAALEEAGDHDLDVLIVLGGDRSIRSAAETCTAEGPFLVPLPGGTMNMLPKALGDDLRWRDALAAVPADPQVRPVHGSRIGKDQFFVAAIISDPALWAEAREAMREGRLGEALKEGREALGKAFLGDLRYAFAGRSGDAEAVSVSCPLTPAVLDGETVELGTAATVAFVPSAFKALVPAHAS